MNDVSCITVLIHYSILFLATMKESDLLDMRKCIVCNQPIEDLDPVDLYILRGTHSQVPDSAHYESKSYYRCINPACLSCHLIMIS